jgi:hypothetical protein
MWSPLKYSNKHLLGNLADTSEDINIVEAPSTSNEMTNLRFIDLPSFTTISEKTGRKFTKSKQLTGLSSHVEPYTSVNNDIYNMRLNGESDEVYTDNLGKKYRIIRPMPHEPDGDFRNFSKSKLSQLQGFTESWQRKKQYGGTKMIANTSNDLNAIKNRLKQKEMKIQTTTVRDDQVPCQKRFAAPGDKMLRVLPRADDTDRGHGESADAKRDNRRSFLTDNMQKMRYKLGSKSKFNRHGNVSNEKSTVSTSKTTLGVEKIQKAMVLSGHREASGTSSSKVPLRKETVFTSTNSNNINVAVPKRVAQSVSEIPTSSREHQTQTNFVQTLGKKSQPSETTRYGEDSFLSKNGVVKTLGKKSQPSETTRYGEDSFLSKKGVVTGKTDQTHARPTVKLNKRKLLSNLKHIVKNATVNVTSSPNSQINKLSKYNVNVNSVPRMKGPEGTRYTSNTKSSWRSLRSRQGSSVGISSLASGSKTTSRAKNIQRQQVLMPNNVPTTTDYLKTIVE